LFCSYVSVSFFLLSYRAHLYLLSFPTRRSSDLLVFFLISGVSGAFLTGDLFNLFVFFEVLLMASYGLITLGGDKKQLRESLKYVIINLFSSIVFVTTIAFLYSVVGTVN